MTGSTSVPPVFLYRITSERSGGEQAGIGSKDGFSSAVVSAVFHSQRFRVDTLFSTHIGGAGHEVGMKKVGFDIFRSGQPIIMCIDLGC